jgi:zinc protease
MIPKLCLLLGCAALAFGAQPQKVFPYEYSQEDLPNGLRLITVPTDYANIVATYIVVQTGSRNEVEPGHTGFAHLFEHLMFRGTEKYPPQKYNQTLNRIGAASNASTDDDLTVYHTTFSKEDLDTVLAMEADRFQHLKYAEPEFKTESLAVLGEYNKNSASPFSKLNEVLHDTAFDKHTYKHTTMGFLKDIQDMPNQYEYSLKFFDRYYRPEYTTIIVVGDVKAKAVRAMVDKYWGEWKRGSYKPDIPVEPAQNGPRTAMWTGRARRCPSWWWPSRRRRTTMRPKRRRRWTRWRTWRSPAPATSTRSWWCRSRRRMPFRPTRRETWMRDCSKSPRG